MAIFNYVYTTKGRRHPKHGAKFPVLMLAMHETVLHRIAEEINEVFGGEYKDLIASYEKLSELKYVKMVLKETLRLFGTSTGERFNVFFRKPLK